MGDAAGESREERNGQDVPIDQRESAGKVNMQVRLRMLDSRLDALKDFRKMDLQQFIDAINDVEHTLSLSAQSIIDICNNLLLEKKKIQAKSFYDIIDKCQHYKLLPPKLTERLARDLVLLDGGHNEIQASEVLELHENLEETLYTFRLFREHVEGMLENFESS
ncbi:MAG: hypothetical protein ACOC54_03490 [Candidatus Sumerlaeota bacterium]